MEQMKDINELGNILENNKVSVVFFSAEWCHNCKALEPTKEELISEMKDKVAFAQVGADTTPDICKKYRVMGLPTTLIFKDGEMKESIVGIKTKEFFTDKISEQF
ncbi:MAG: trxA1 [Clostridiaceae bacterium]|jgi:thioredoxin 1|nr:trxA1 [Clostridiaceae bacterium]